jgi:hypothetical protein
MLARFSSWLRAAHVIATLLVQDCGWHVACHDEGEHGCQ